MRSLLTRIRCALTGHTMREIPGSWRMTGEITLSWSMRLTPEYETRHECVRCGYTTTQQWVTPIAPTFDNTQSAQAYIHACMGVHI